MEEVVDQLRAAFGAQTPAQIREANAWLESFQGRAEAWQVADQLLAMPYQLLECADRSV